MKLLNYILVNILFLLSGCSDYPSGYHEGYEGINKKQWIVFGRNDYLRGYLSGQAEKFQADWLLENPIEAGLLHCPTYVFPADPLMFLPVGYNEIAPNIYRSD